MHLVIVQIILNGDESADLLLHLRVAQRAVSVPIAFFEEVGIETRHKLVHCYISRHNAGGRSAVGLFVIRFWWVEICPSKKRCGTTIRNLRSGGSWPRICAAIVEACGTWAISCLIIKVGSGEIKAARSARSTVSRRLVAFVEERNILAPVRPRSARAGTLLETVSFSLKLVTKKKLASLNCLAKFDEKKFSYVNPRLTIWKHAR